MINIASLILLVSKILYLIYYYLIFNLITHVGIWISNLSAFFSKFAHSSRNVDTFNIPTNTRSNK